MNLHRIFISPVRWILERIPAGRNFCAAYRSAREKRRKSAAIARLHRYGTGIIEEVSKALSDSGAVYFADFGTLLGATREGSFIPHDDDIDLGVLPGEWSPKRLLGSDHASRVAEMTATAPPLLLKKIWSEGERISRS